MNNAFLAPIKARATIILAVTGADCNQTLPLGEASPKLPRQKLSLSQSDNFTFSDNPSSTHGRKRKLNFS